MEYFILTMHVLSVSMQLPGTVLLILKYLGKTNDRIIIDEVF